MGTRSLTVFLDDGTGEEIAVLYRQYDGYPEFHGAELKKFLQGGRVVNGIGATKGKIFNGMSCLAAQVVAHFKTEVGQFYLHPAGTRNIGEDFVYILSNKGNRIWLKAFGEKVFYNNFIDKFPYNLEEENFNHPQCGNCGWLKAQCQC